MDEEKEARKQERARLVLAGHPLSGDDDDPFEGLTPRVHDSDFDLPCTDTCKTACIQDLQVRCACLRSMPSLLEARLGLTTSWARVRASCLEGCTKAVLHD